MAICRMIAGFLYNYYLSRQREKMDYFYNFKRNKRRSNYVIQKDVIHKGKTFQFRADAELTKNIQEMAKEFNETESKVIKDILTDFFLELNWNNQKEDVKDFLERA